MLRLASFHQARKRGRSRYFNPDLEEQDALLFTLQACASDQSEAK
jgi:hypothetical protein